MTGDRLEKQSSPDSTIRIRRRRLALTLAGVFGFCGVLPICSEKVSELIDERKQAIEIQDEQSLDHINAEMTKYLALTYGSLALSVAGAVAFYRDIRDTYPEIFYGSRGDNREA